MSAVDVVILTWNDGELLDRAVASALTSQGVEVNVIVVDNGSAPPATTVPDARITLVRNETNRGVAPARNQGVALGRSKYICLLDSDAVLHPDALSRLVAAIESSDEVALAAPVFTDQRPEASAGRAPTVVDKLFRALNLRGDYRGVVQRGAWWDVDFAIGACQVVRRDAWVGVSGLDETYFYGPEDVDFCLRLREHGWRVVQGATAVVDHPPRRRNRRLLTRRGIAHARAVSRHLWRHRRFNHNIKRRFA